MAHDTDVSHNCHSLRQNSHPQLLTDVVHYINYTLALEIEKDIFLSSSVLR